MLIRDFLAASGFDSKAAGSIQAVPRYWARPPLTTPLMLAGNDLQPHVTVECVRGTDLFVDVYERFIAGYVRRKVYRDSVVYRWFAEELQIGHSAVKQMFTLPGVDTVRLNAHLNLVQFAALVYGNTESTLEEGASTFAVRTMDGHVFGVRDGALLTNLNRGLKPVPVRFLHSPSGRLQDIARGGTDYTGEVTIFDTVAQWADVNKRKLGSDYHGLQLALRTLWWRSRRRTIAAVSDLLLDENTPEAWSIALDYARRYEQYASPLEAMRGILVPQFLSGKRFSQMFGGWHNDKGKISEATRCRWNEALNELEASVVVPA